MPEGSCYERARELLGEIACEMAEVWDICVKRGLVEELPDLCLAAYGAVLRARGGVVRRNFEDFLGRAEALGRARSRLLPYEEDYVEYETFIKTLAARYILLKNALLKAVGHSNASLPEVLKRIKSRELML